MAKRVKYYGMSLSDISKATGLSISEIENL